MTKRTIFILIGIWVFSIVAGAIGFIYYNQYLITNDPLQSCYRTGGNVQVKTGRAGPLGCKGFYPQTKLERINVEEFPKVGMFCPAVVPPPSNQCRCEDGKYFGSYEEGCIPLSEKKSVIRAIYN